MNLLRRFIAALTAPMTCVAEREYLQTCKKRPKLDDGEIYNDYYADSEIAFDTCSRVLQVLRIQLNMSNVRPDDNVAQIFDDVDFAEICFEIGEEFELNFPLDMIGKMDGTVDSIIRMTERLRKTSSNDDRGWST